MIKTFIKIWNDPVGSKVIATGLCAVLAAFCLWLLGYWPQIKVILLYILSFFTYKVGIPIWLLIIIILCAIFLIPILENFRRIDEPAFLKYRNDNILGIEWHWDWSSPTLYSDKYSIKDLYARCPDCKSSLELNNYSGQLVNCINDSCNWKWRHQGDFGNRISNSDVLKQKVWNVIDRKIHNNEF